LHGLQTQHSMAQHSTEQHEHRQQGVDADVACVQSNSAGSLPAAGDHGASGLCCRSIV
jgi:hypothetical protein